MSFTNVALSLVSFLIALGYSLDYFRQTGLRPLSRRLKKGGLRWGNLVYGAIVSTEKLLTYIFGEKLISRKLVFRAVIISAVLNMFILSVFFTVNEIKDLIEGRTARIDFYWLKTLFVHVMAPTVPGMLHDIVSLIITRYLIRSYLNGRNLLTLIFDVVIAILLFKSTRATLAMGFDVAFDQLIDGLSYLSIFMFALETWFQAFISGSIGLGATEFTICSLSTLLPTWFYVVAAVSGAFMMSSSRLARYLLVLLRKGGQNRYTAFFTIGSVVLVFLAIPVDLLTS